MVEDEIDVAMNMEERDCLLHSIMLYWLWGKTPAD
jgi:hypothetical protein